MDRRRRHDLAVERERHRVADVRARVLAPDRLARALEGHVHDVADALAVRGGLRARDLGAFQERRAEHVLGGAVLVARDERERRVVVAGERVGLAAVERLQRDLLCGRVAALPDGLGCRDLLGQLRIRRPGRRPPPRRRWGRPRAPGQATARGGRLQRAGVGDRLDGLLGRVGGALRLRGRRPRGRDRRGAGAAPGAAPVPPGAGAAGAGAAEHGLPDHRPEAQLRGLAQRTGLLTGVARHGDRDVVAVEHDLGTAHAEAVDALLDDLLGLHELVARRGAAVDGAGHERDPRAALQVDAELRRGLPSPVKNTSAYSTTTMPANAAR